MTNSPFPLFAKLASWDRCVKANSSDWKGEGNYVDSKEGNRREQPAVSHFIQLSTCRRHCVLSWVLRYQRLHLIVSEISLQRLPHLPHRAYLLTSTSLPGFIRRNIARLKVSRTFLFDKGEKGKLFEKLQFTNSAPGRSSVIYVVNCSQFSPLTASGLYFQFIKFLNSRPTSSSVGGSLCPQLPPRLFKHPQGASDDI